MRDTVELRTSRLLKSARELEADGEMTIRDIRDIDVKFVPKLKEAPNTKPDTRSLPHTLTWKTAYNPRACARHCTDKPPSEDVLPLGDQLQGSMAFDFKRLAPSLSSKSPAAGAPMDADEEDTRHGWARYRPDEAVLKERAKEREVREAIYAQLHASPSGIRAILIGQRVLARHTADGMFYVGRVHSAVGREEYLVDFEARDPDGFRERHFWPVHVHDLIAFEDALLHPLEAGDKVLAPVLLDPSHPQPVRKPPPQARNGSANAKVVQHEQLASRKSSDRRIPFAPASVVAGEESRQISEKDIQTPIEQILYGQKAASKESKKKWSDDDSDDDEAKEKAEQRAAQFEFEGVAELLQRPPPAKPIQVVFYTGESATIPANTAIWIPVEAYNRLRLEATMPARARGTLARTPGYPANSLPGYPTSGPNAKKQLDYFEARTVEGDELLVDYALPLRALPVYPILKRVPEIPAHSRLHSHLRESLSAEALAKEEEKEAHKFPRHLRVTSQGAKSAGVQVEELAYAERGAQTSNEGASGPLPDGRSLAEMEYFDAIRKEARWGVLAHSPPPPIPPPLAGPYRPPAVASHATQTASANELHAHPVDKLPAPGAGLGLDDGALAHKCERHRLEAQLDRVRAPLTCSPRVDALLDRRDLRAHRHMQPRHSRHPGRQPVASPELQSPERKLNALPAAVHFASREHSFVDRAVGPDLLPDFRHSRQPGRHWSAEAPDIFGSPEAMPKPRRGNQSESMH